MSKEARVITLESLRYGAKFFQIDFGPNTPFNTLKSAIEAELSRHPSHGAFACSNCSHDVIDTMPFCPYCKAEFIRVTPPMLDVDEEDAVVVPQTTRETNVAEVEVALHQAEVLSSVDTDDPPEELVEEEDDWEDEEWGEVEDMDFGPGPAEDALEHTPIPIKQHDPDPGTPPKPPSKKSKAAAKTRKAMQDREKDRKRMQIMQELPYTPDKLKGFKRQALMMIAGVLEVQKPISLGSNENIIKAVLEKQGAKYG